MRLIASYFATADRTPFCLSRASWSVQTKHPVSSMTKPLRYSCFKTGRGFKMISFEKYLGDGHAGSLGRFRSWKELRGV